MGRIAIDALGQFTMATTETKLLARLQTMLGTGQANALRDDQLLERFTVERDQTAFAVLVRRHGPMVLNVCRRVLHHAADAEDAFQATFLVLARKADAIGKRQALAAWLHRVAYRLALRARKQASTRRQLEQHSVGRLGSDPLDALTGRELLTVLDEELLSLPAAYQGPLILCYLEERTREEAARQLGLSMGTLKRRLELGRASLRRRLERRGLALPAAFLTLGSLRLSVRAALPDVLTATTTRICLQTAAGKGVAEVVSAQTAALVSSTLRTMALGKLLAVGALLFAMTLVAAGFSVAVSGGQASPSASQANAPALAPVKGHQPGVSNGSQPAESLPAGARARLGQERFLNIGRVFALAYSPDGRHLASGAWDGSLRLWNTATGKEQHLLNAHQGPVQHLAFSPDGRVLASVGSEPGLCLWNVVAGRPLRTIQGKGFSRVAFSPDGSKLAGITGGKLHVWDDTGKELWRDGDERTPLRRFYTDCAFRGNKTIAAVLHEWQEAPGSSTTYLVTRSLGPDREADSQKQLPGRDSCAGFGPDASFLALRVQSKTYETTVWYFPLDSARPARSVRIPNQIGSFLCVSPDRRMIALSGDSWNQEDSQSSKFIQVLEISTGQERCRFECPTDKGKLTLAFSPDCRTLSSSSVDMTVLLWDLTGRVKNTERPVAANELAERWKELMSPNGELAYRALWRLVGASEQAAEYLAGVLRPAPPADLERINTLIRDLGDPRLTVRHKAIDEIGNLEDVAEPALRKSLGGNLELEVRRRIERLLTDLDRLSPEKVREIRAVELLERIHTPSADRLLLRLAHGSPAARMTREAVEACRRLKIQL
jgi:RNA polymerase sigma factor (sigma-70 family)